MTVLMLTSNLEKTAHSALCWFTWFVVKVPLRIQRYNLGYHVQSLKEEANISYQIWLALTVPLLKNLVFNVGFLHFFKGN